MHLVTSGTGALHTLGKVTPLEAGDIFFTFPAEAYGIEIAAVIRCEPGDALSPAQLGSLVKTVKELGNPPLFTEPQYDDVAAQTIAAETGASVYTLDPIVTGPDGDAALTHYETVMRQNAATLLEALK